MQADTQASYEVKYIADSPQPRYVTTWLTPDGRDRFIKSMTDQGWDVVRITRLFDAGVRHTAKELDA